MNRLTAVIVFVAAALIGIAPSTAQAFCGFYVSGADKQLTNNATMVVLMRGGTRTVLSMQNNYEGPPENFAMVVPVPVVLQKENVKTLSQAVFDKVDTLGSPRLVEYWEQDPCNQEAADDGLGAGIGSGRGRLGAGRKADADEPKVKIEAQFAVGEYEIVILSATDSTALADWLTQNKYKMPANAAPYLQPYVQSGSKFFVAKVDVSKVKMVGGQAQLAPLRFYYDSDTFSLPVRLGLINSKGTQDLIVNILADNQRYEVANYSNVTIPTNIDVADDVRGSFAAFYNQLFDRATATHPRTAVTEYSWPAGFCDPCPVPSAGLDFGDLATLGADVMPKQDTGDTGPARGRGGFVGSSFVLTRIHVRYAKDSLGDDLVFSKAQPIVGGREYLMNGGEIEKGARPDTTNNFQARYVNRHAWTGAIACAAPRRGVWGGPTANVKTQPPIAPATKIAFAPRGGSVDLASLVREDVPELGVWSKNREHGAGVTAPEPQLSEWPTGSCLGCAIVQRDDTRTAGAAIGAFAIGAALIARRARRRAR
jgi:hypothetical protein